MATREANRADPKITDLDVWALVVRLGVRNTADNRHAHLQLVSYAKNHCGDSMDQYLWKWRSQLPQIIDDTWLWENADAEAAESARTRMETMAVAFESKCVCGGE